MSFPDENPDSNEYAEISHEVFGKHQGNREARGFSQLGRPNEKYGIELEVQPEIRVAIRSWFQCCHRQFFSCFVRDTEIFSVVLRSVYVAIHFVNPLSVACDATRAAALAEKTTTASAATSVVKSAKSRVHHQEAPPPERVLLIDQPGK